MAIISIIVVLCSNAVTNRRDKSILYARMALAILICCLLICLNSFYSEFYDKGLGLFNGFFHTTAISHIFHIFFFIISGLILQLNAFFPRKVWTNKNNSLFSIISNKLIYYNSYILNKFSNQFRILEYPLLILFVVTGGSFLISSSDFISLFLSVELQSYGLYILCTVYKNSEKAAQGGLTYFLLGSFSSCFILLASSLLYANSGNTSFDGLFVINNISSVSHLNNVSLYQGVIPEAEYYSETAEEGLLSLNAWYESYYISFSLVILSVGFLFKMSAAPFHFWSPDVYDAIPTIVTTFVAIFAKISVLVILLELVHYTSNFSDTIAEQNFNIDNLNYQIIAQHSEALLHNEQQNLSYFNFNSEHGFDKEWTPRWTFALLISSILSLVIGTVLGLTQSRVKRLYAYSTISHIGFILLALSINSIESIQSFIFYLMQYSLSNLNAFFLLIAISYLLYFYTAQIDSIKNTSKKELNSLTKFNNSNTFESLDKQSSLYKNEQLDLINSPLQLITQMKGLFYINPVISVSLAITLFSFVGIPPLMGFFAKQMVLSSSLDSGYIFITFIAIITSVISAYYYLAVIKQIFFFKSDYELNPKLQDISIKLDEKQTFEFFSLSKSYDLKSDTKFNTNIKNIRLENITLSNYLSITISILTLITLFFIITPQEWLNMANILALLMFSG